MNESVMVRYDSPESSFQVGANFIGTCPYIEVCSLPRVYREEKKPNGDSMKDIEDYYKEVCESEGASSCLTKKAFEDVLQEAINGDSSDYDFDHPVEASRLSQIRYSSGFNPEEIYALVIRGNLP